MPGPIAAAAAHVALAFADVVGMLVAMGVLVALLAAGLLAWATTV